MSKNCKDVTAAIKVIDWAYQSTSNYLIGSYGTENVGWSWVDQSKGTFKPVNGLQNNGNEYFTMMGGILELKVSPIGSTMQKHYDYLKNSIQDLSRAKQTLDFNIKYDAVAMNTAVPNYADVQRVVDTYSVQFIMGQKPMSAYSSFLTDLNTAGVDKLITEITRQYNALSKK